MHPRIDHTKVSPKAIEAMFGLERYVSQSGLSKNLLDLVRLRVSQINGCAFCIDMHTKELREAGESEQRLYLLDAWRDSPFYDDKERAALAWAEAVTLVTEGHVPDEIHDQARSQFSEQELVDLTIALVAINGWNRLNIGFRTVPGGYRPPHPSETSAGRMEPAHA
jgi:AhpD family alkylhydroperoxidase